VNGRYVRVGVRANTTNGNYILRGQRLVA